MSEMKPIEVFTSLDLEMNQPSGRIIQIGACAGNIRTGEILHTVRLYVNPREQLNPEITKLTKITQEDVDHAYTLEEAYRILQKIHMDRKSFVNPITWGGGDSAELFKQLKEENPIFEGWCFGRRWLDTKTLFVSWRFSNGQPIQGGLARSMTKVGLKFEGQKHDALDDATNTFRMYIEMLKIMKDGSGV